MKLPSFKLLPLFLLSFLLSLFCFAGKLTEEQINRVNRSIVRITVNGKIGTGFIYSNQKYAVTAFHVISGSTGVVKVQYPSLGLQSYTGKVIKTLKAADLALIEIQNFRNVPPLKLSSYNPAFDAEFTTIGFLWDASNTYSKNVTKKENKILSSFIPSTTKQDIINAGCPSLDMSVYSFEGNPFVPGYSGAPVFHNDEGIIGISDGGIMNGLASVSWAIPANHLNLLMNSNEYAIGNPIKSQSHFQADVIENPNYASETITIGQRKFSKVRTERLLTIINSTDDILGLNQLLSTFPPQIDRNILFDVYQEFSSGATFIVPSKFDVRNYPDRMEVTSPDGGSALTVKIKPLPAYDIAAMQSASLQLEQAALTTKAGFFWNFEPNFTYRAPLVRPDGFWVRRLSFIQYKPASQFTPVTFSQHLFESFIYKKDVIIQLYTVNNNYNNNYFAQRLQCDTQGFQTAGCSEILNELKNWMALITATHFATFSFE